MSKKSGSGFILPVILFGASLFGFGAYQATKPIPVEVNKGFETVAPQLPADLRGTVDDAAQRAASDDVASTPDAQPATPDAPPEPAPVQDLSLVTAYPWLSELASSQGLNFKEKTLAALLTQTESGNLACRPNLAKLDAQGRETLEEVRCLAKAGEEVNVSFDNDGDGNINVEREDGTRISLSRSRDGLNLNVSGN